MMKILFRGAVLATLTMGIINNGPETILASVLVYAIAMKSFNFMAREVQSV
jgi:hypothetical protein